MPPSESDEVAALRAEVAELRRRLDYIEGFLRQAFQPQQRQQQQQQQQQQRQVEESPYDRRGQTGIEPTEPWNLGPRSGGGNR